VRELEVKRQEAQAESKAASLKRQVGWVSRARLGQQAGLVAASKVVSPGGVDCALSSTLLPLPPLCRLLT
jgi:hypothetical protein